MVKNQDIQKGIYKDTKVSYDFDTCPEFEVCWYALFNHIIGYFGQNLVGWSL